MKEIDPIKFMLLLGWAYRLIGRGIIKAAIDDPNTEWDDAVMDLLDRIFGYEGD
ncbi:hypothetical protein LCGC14_0771640 [marine sediment metagenome]|uniref:Uncharacterized protein n=1 Tax=marine sediment metagenome TaxID=412755 RepID=A0A0F9SI68_9ZZZZ